MSEVERRTKISLPSDPSLTEDLVHLAAREESASGRLAGWFFAIVGMVGLAILVMAVERAGQPLADDAQSVPAVLAVTGFIAILLGVTGAALAFRGSRKISEVLRRH